MNKNEFVRVKKECKTAPIIVLLTGLVGHCRLYGDSDIRVSLITERNSYLIIPLENVIHIMGESLAEVGKEDAAYFDNEPHQ